MHDEHSLAINRTLEITDEEAFGNFLFSHRAKKKIIIIPFPIKLQTLGHRAMLIEKIKKSRNINVSGSFGKSALCNGCTCAWITERSSVKSQDASLLSVSAAMTARNLHYRKWQEKLWPLELILKVIPTLGGCID